MNKTYNTERNFSYELLYNIINTSRNNREVIIITKDTDINFKELQDSCDKNLTELNTDWDSIIKNIIKDGECFISGDCGLTHFISLLPFRYKPRIISYYKTKHFINNNCINEFDKRVRVINFRPYSPYITDSIKIRTF